MEDHRMPSSPEQASPSLLSSSANRTQVEGNATSTTTAHGSPAESLTHQQQQRRRHQRETSTASVGDKIRGEVDEGVPGLERIGLDGNAALPRSGAAPQDEAATSFPSFAGDKPWSRRSWMYQFIPFRGMWYDLRRRAPYYLSDWTATFLPKNWWTAAQAVVRIYFINLMPAIAYVLDMYHRTRGAYGVNEVILASALAAIVFPIFSVQPLTFVGVTGLINLVNYTQYDIVVEYYGLDQMDYLRVQAWSLIWAAGFHFLAAIFNLCDFTRFITDMTSTTFGFYVGIVYIQKGIELLILEYEPSPLDNATGWLSVTTAMLFVVSVYLVSAIGKTSYLPYHIRTNISTFAFAAGCIFWTGFTHFPEYSLERVPIERLPITKSFFPTMDRSWFIDFWNIEARWAFVGAPLGFLITILFWFDHNVSSVMAQARQFPVKRPAGFHWDFFLLGITTLVAGLLGLPAPNGLVPQCPWHTEALSVFKQVKVDKADDEEKTRASQPSATSHAKKSPRVRKQPSVPAREHIVNTRVVEQRGSHLLIGALTLATMTRPFLVALGTMPRAVFAGIFILVGWGSIEGNIITSRTLAVFRDRALAPADDPLNQVRRSKIALFVAIQWFFFAITFAISQTIAGIGFPVLITLLIPFRYYVVPKWFSPLELRILDAPTADADVVLASIGHESERCTGQGVQIAADTKIAGTEYDVDEDEYRRDDDDEAGNPLPTSEKQTSKSGQSHSPDTTRPYVIDGDEFQLQSAQHYHDQSGEPRATSRASAVQPSPFTDYALFTDYAERPTSVNMREQGIAYLNVPDDGAAAEGSAKRKKNRQSLISRLLHRSQADSPQNEGDRAEQAGAAVGQPTSSGPAASELPAMPASKPEDNALGLSDADDSVAKQNEESHTAQNNKEDEAPASPLGEANPADTEQGGSAVTSGPAKESAAVTGAGEAGTTAGVEPETSAVASESMGNTDPSHTAGTAPAPAIPQSTSAHNGSGTEETPAHPSTNLAGVAPAVPTKQVASDSPTTAEAGSKVAADPANASTDGSNNVKTTAGIAAAAGVGGGTAASAIAAAHGKAHPDAADQHEAARQAAAETLARAEEQKKQLDEQKKNKKANKQLIKEQQALEKKRIAESKKTMKEEEKKRKQAVKDIAAQEKESHRLALLQADREKRRLDDHVKSTKEQKSLDEQNRKQQEKEQAEEAKRQKQAEADAAKKQKEDEKAKKAAEAEAAKKQKEDEKAQKAAEAEAAKKAKEEEKAKKEQEAAEAKKAKEEEKARKEQEATEAKKAKEEEKAQKEQEAAEAKKKEQEAEKQRAEQEQQEKQAKEAAEEKERHEKEAAAAAAAATAAAAAEAEREKKQKEQEEEEQRKQKAAEEEQRRKEETEKEEQARKEQEAEQARQAREAEAEQKAQKEEEEKKAKEEAEAKKAAEVAAAKKAKEEEDARKAAEAEEAKKAKEEADAKKAAELAAAKKAKEEEDARKAKEAEAAKKAKEEAKAKKAAEKKEAKEKKAAEKEAAKKAKADEKARKAQEADDAKKAKKAAEEKAKHEKEAAAAAAAATAAAVAAEEKARRDSEAKRKTEEEAANSKQQEDAKLADADAGKQREVLAEQPQSQSPHAGEPSQTQAPSETVPPKLSADETAPTTTATPAAVAAVPAAAVVSQKEEDPTSHVSESEPKPAPALSAAEPESRHPEADHALAQSEAARADLEAGAESAKADALADQKKSRREAQIPPKAPESVAESDEHDAELAGLAATAAAVAGGAHVATSGRNTPPTPPKDTQASKDASTSQESPTNTAAVAAAKSSGEEDQAKPSLLKRIFSTKRAGPPARRSDSKTASANGNQQVDGKKNISAPTPIHESESDAAEDQPNGGKSLLMASGLGLGAAGVARGKSTSSKAGKSQKAKKDLPDVPGTTPAKDQQQVSDGEAPFSQSQPQVKRTVPAVAPVGAPETPEKTVSRKKSKKEVKDSSESSTQRRTSVLGGVFSSSLPGAPGRSQSRRGKGVGGSNLVEQLSDTPSQKEEVRVIHEGDQVFEEHINPRFANKPAGGSKVSAVQWRH